MGKPWVFDKEKEAILDGDEVVIRLEDFKEGTTIGLLRRIAACVNFCHGIHSDQLERATHDREAENYDT